MALHAFLVYKNMYLNFVFVVKTITQKDLLKVNNNDILFMEDLFTRF